jgi:thiamine kinase-like enzyme
MRETILDVLQKIPHLKNASSDQISIEQLGGQTNRNFKLTVGSDRYVLRIAGVGTDMFINRESDEENSIIAAEIGVSTKVVFVDQRSGIMLREFVDGTALKTESFQKPGIIERVATVLRRVHCSGRTFRSRFSILEKLNEYEEMLRRSGGPLPIDYFELAIESRSARDALAALPVKLSPCHNDLVAANFLDSGDQMLVLDWEYSGMNDPMFDLAALAAEGYFTPGQEELLLSKYFGEPAPDECVCRVSLYRALWNQWVTMWSMVQIANWNVNDDFWKFGMMHFDEFRLAVADPGFKSKIAAIRLG